MRTAFFSLVLILSNYSLVLGEASGLPESVRNDQNPKDKTIAPDESLRRIKVPDGFHVTLFAAEPDAAQPIAADFDDRGRLWVAECFSHPVWKPTGHDRILIFEDIDGNGKFDERKIFWDKGNYLTGLLYGHGGVWICNTPNLMFIPDRNRDDVPDGPPEIHLDGWVRNSPHNVLNNLTWGPDGWMYGCIGIAASSFVGKPGTPKSERVEIQSGIWRYHPVRRKFEAVAHGAVNPWGLDFNDWGEGFFTNCVIGHLWHLVPGAYYQRRNFEKDDPLAYTRIEPISDHLHWGGGDGTYGYQKVHSLAGGGHAHTGAMVYLGDNWPDRYRNTFFTGNIHGNRINNDTLERTGSGYIGRHGPDFLYGNHEWFRCLWEKYGPDGSVFIGDWHDYGECHDKDGTHRTSGRIYRIRYGGSKGQRPKNLAELSDLELVAQQRHRNDWYVRHARRLLHERAVAGHDLSAARRELLRIVNEDREIKWQLCAMWTLYVINAADEEFLRNQLSHPNEHVRAWAVRLLSDSSVPSNVVVERFQKMGASESSALVRLYLASALQRLPLDIRWKLAQALATHEQDAGDHNLPHMLWYGIAPLIATDTTRAIQLLVKTEIPLVRQHIARCVATADHLGAIDDPKAQLDVLRGLRQGLRGVKKPPVPKGWARLYAQARKNEDPQLRREARFVALFFGDEHAEQSIRNELMNPESKITCRNESLHALVESRVAGLAPSLQKLLDDPRLRRPALRGLAAYNEPTTPQKVLDRFRDFNTDARQDAINLLASRPAFALRLLQAVKKQIVDRRDISAYTARQMAALGNADVAKQLREVWGEVRKTPDERRQRIAEYKLRLTPEILDRADVISGRRVYEQTCMKCHRLFGRGGTIGPDLTGSNRNNLDYVLENVLDPSAAVAKDYQLWTVATDDGRVVTGIIAERDEKRVILQTIDQQVVLSTDDIDEMQMSSVSIMPEGQIEKLPLDAVRDLIAYLAVREPVPLSEAADRLQEQNQPDK